MKSPEPSSLASSTGIVDPGQVRAQLERILASTAFGTAKSAGRFLRYVVEETLAGRGDRIKEYVLGIAVFGRGDRYDPRVDAVVRVEATRLRSRLRDYYLHDGRADPVAIALPKGNYVPVFRPRQPEASPSWPFPALWRRKKTWAGAAVGAVLAMSVIWWGRLDPHPFRQVQSIVVLPLENSSGDNAQDYIADGLTDALTTELRRIPKLRVISPSAAVKYPDSQKVLSQIAGELNVEALVGGSVMRKGERVGINVRVVDPQARELWSQSYERGVSDIPALQKEVARAIAAGIRAELPPQKPTQFASSPAANPEAYDHYLRGRFYARRQNRGDIETAILALERAVAIDHNFASAYAELALAYVWKVYLFSPEERHWEENAFVAAEKALSLDPNLAVAHLARGRLLWLPSNHFPHEKAIREYRRALALDPNLDEARNQLALIYCHIGYFDQALDESQQAVLANPNNNMAVYRTGQTLVFRGDYEQALSVLRSIPEEANPALIGYQTAWALFNLGRREEASLKVEQLSRDYPHDDGGVFTSVQAVLAASAGDKRTAEVKIRSAIEKGKGFGHFHHTAYHIAAAFALMNKPEQAIQWLETAAGDGFPCYPLFEKDANLDSLRQDRRFVEFMAKLKQQWTAYSTLF